MAQRQDDAVARDLAKVVWQLMEKQPLSNAILSLLSTPGAAASGKQLSFVLRRRLTTVLNECRRLEREGRLERRGTKWHRVTEDQR